LAATFWLGFAIQHFVDPDDVSLDLYPELYVLLLGPSRADSASRRRRCLDRRGRFG
jgi:hypothetical protein